MSSRRGLHVAGRQFHARMNSTLSSASPRSAAKSRIIASHGSPSCKSSFATGLSSIITGRLSKTGLGAVVFRRCVVKPASASTAAASATRRPTGPMVRSTVGVMGTSRTRPNDRQTSACPRTSSYTVTLGGRRTADAGDGSELRVGRVSEPRGGCREAVCALAGAGQPPFGVSRALGRVHGAVARRATLLAAHVAPAARPRPLYERGPLAQPPHAPLAAGARKRSCAVSPLGEGVSVSLRRVRASQA